jgi:hypothetical protein
MSLEGTIEPELVRVPAGEFLIGSGQRYQGVIDILDPGAEFEDASGLVLVGRPQPEPDHRRS